MKQDQIDINWAVKVDEAVVGARLEAYFETKACITALMLSIQNQQSAPTNGENPTKTLAKPPLEVICMIKDEIMDQSYRSKIAEWRVAKKCIKHDCDSIDHGVHPDRLSRFDWYD